MIFPQCQSSSRDTTRFDGTKVRNYIKNEKLKVKKLC